MFLLVAAIVFAQLAQFCCFDVWLEITVQPDTVNNNVVPFCLSLFIKPFTASWFWTKGGQKKKVLYLLTDFSHDIQLMLAF